MKKAVPLILSSSLLVSCSWFKNNPSDPQFQRQTTATDPVGIEYHREDARKRAEEGRFMPGSEVSVREGKAYMFDRNPGVHPDALGTMREADKVKVVFNDGRYTKVKLSTGKEAWVHERDLEGGSPEEFEIPEGGSLFADDFLGEMPVVSDSGDAQVVYDKNGRERRLVRRPAADSSGADSSPGGDGDGSLPEPAAVQDQKNRR